jgi:hypothetical protein
LPVSSSLSGDVVLHCPLCLRERGELIRYAMRQMSCAVCHCEALEPLEFAGSQHVLPNVEEALSDPSASCWLKHALRSALERDPVDAANDAEVLAQLLDKRSRLVLTQL